PQPHVHPPDRGGVPVRRHQSAGGIEIIDVALYGIERIETPTHREASPARTVGRKHRRIGGGVSIREREQLLHFVLRVFSGSRGQVSFVLRDGGGDDPQRKQRHCGYQHHARCDARFDETRSAFRSDEAHCFLVHPAVPVGLHQSCTREVADRVVPYTPPLPVMYTASPAVGAPVLSIGIPRELNSTHAVFPITFPASSW